MGCFCRETVRELHETNAPEQPVGEPREEDEVIPAISEWLQARWLPAPPWKPDPEWLEIEPPPPPMEPRALAVILGLIQAHRECEAYTGLDVTDPDQVRKFARIVGTLNRRMEDFRWIEEETAPWEALAARCDRIETVRRAVEQKMFDVEPDEEEQEPFQRWRKLFSAMKAIAPFVAIGQLLGMDLAVAETPERLARKVRELRKVKLPKLENPLLVMRVIARASAINRLRDTLGADPSRAPWTRVEDAIDRKRDAVMQTLPKTLRVRDKVVNLAPRQPNPTEILNPDMIRLVRKIPADIAERLRWQVPAYDQLDLLTAAAPVATLSRLMRVAGRDPIRASPCGHHCDAGIVGRELDMATGSRGSGTGAGPAA